MDVGALLLAPVRTVRLVGRALEDLNTLAERARREPDPVVELRERVEVAVAELGTLVRLLGDAVGEVRTVTVTLRGVHDAAREVVAVAASLVVAAERVDATAEEIVVGGRDLTDTTKSVDAHSVEIITGGQDLTAVAQRLDESLRVFRAALPRLLSGLDTVEHLEDAVETVAETVEPLQGAAERVGRMTRRLSRGDSRG